MKKVIWGLLVSVLISMSGCNGSGTVEPPLPQNMAGIQGMWIYSLTFDGYMEMGGDVIPYSRQADGYFFIGVNGITDERGVSWTWKYDGLNLIVTSIQKRTWASDDYGTIQAIETIWLNMEIIEGDMFADAVGGLTGTGIGELAPRLIYITQGITGTLINSTPTAQPH